MKLSLSCGAAGYCLAAAALAISLSGCSQKTALENVTFQQISLQEFQKSLTSVDVPDRAIVDARSSDAFNGWYIVNGIPQRTPAGHVPGAQLFSASWVEQGMDDVDQAWRRTGITQQQPIIIYGDTVQQAETVGRWLVAHNAAEENNIRLLAAGADALKKLDKPLDYLPGFRTLVPAAYVEHTLKTNAGIKIVQIGWDGGKGSDYREAHIPGALYWDDLEFEYPPIYEAYPADHIRDSLSQLGITKDSSVIVYSTESIGAARGAAIMKYAGVKDVMMLNGGIEAWQRNGYKTDSGWVDPVPAQGFGMKGDGNKSVIINVDEAAQLRKQPNSALVSIRAWDEYLGNVSGYNYFSKRGRIPGALWGHAGNSSFDMNAYHNPDGTMRDYQHIAQFWNDWGIHPDMNLSFYCGNGWRASEAWWYARAMGYENSSIYSSGWMRWREDGREVASSEITREESIAKWAEVSGSELPVMLADKQ
ncbi:rhodanese-like domain-containing protein [Sansalvadorimonas verongulae]|uniref:rhodanese-like domain-containing protein n=1 Tax=Sansalvadorimonas verongulae TaxID=2172824 RepID=UPI0012BCD1F9|nr:rhodanese-like domain-containing protein [Sansalvadorimonas verongulae]MTI13140.1 hypothetical protein [Sansalvadorimonas verongulae]